MIINLINFYPHKCKFLLFQTLQKHSVTECAQYYALTAAQNLKLINQNSPIAMIHSTPDMQQTLL